MFAKSYCLLIVLLLCLSLIIPVSAYQVSVEVSTNPQAENILSERSTYSLVDEILNDNYWIDLFCTNSIDTAYSYWISEYELFAELESRHDAVTILLDRYTTLAQLEDIECNMTAFGQKFLISSLLSQPIYRNQITASNYTELAYYGSNLMSTTLANNQPESFQDDAQYVTYTHVADYLTLDNNTVYLYQADRDFYDLGKTELIEKTLNEYPYLTNIATASTKYNCHSYAWYSQSFSNPYWIIGIEQFVDDPHYVTVSKSSAQVGDIVVYYRANGSYTHSAVITTVSTGSSMVPIITCESKWGQNGVYRHDIAYVHEAYSDNPSNPTYIIKRPVGEHTITGSYAQYNATSHRRYCKHCTASSILPHTFTCTYTSSKHTKTCSLCNYSITETHTYNNMTGACTVCGYTPGFNPINSVRPEIMLLKKD